MDGIIPLLGVWVLKFVYVYVKMLFVMLVCIGLRFGSVSRMETFYFTPQTQTFDAYLCVSVCVRAFDAYGELASSIEIYPFTELIGVHMIINRSTTFNVQETISAAKYWSICTYAIMNAHLCEIKRTTPKIPHIRPVINLWNFVLAKSIFWS